MINHNMGKASKYVGLIPRVAAGTTTITPSGTNVTASGYLDTIGYTSAHIIGVFSSLVNGTITSIKVTYSDDGTTSLGDAAGSNTLISAAVATAAAAGGTTYPLWVPTIILDIFEVMHRYILVSVIRSTQNVAIDSVGCILYHVNNAPSALDASVVTKVTLAQPLVGTA